MGNKKPGTICVLLMLYLSLAFSLPITCAGQDVPMERRPPPELGADGQMRWGSDGTRHSLSMSLDRFFDGKTGNFGPVLDDARRQPDGKYLVSDQFRLPLYGLASLEKSMRDGTVIYQAFVHRNPYVRCFIKANAANEIIAAALTDMLSVKRDGKVVDIKPRIVVFFKTESPPEDLTSEARSQMNQFYQQGGLLQPKDIELVLEKLPVAGSANYK